MKNPLSIKSLTETKQKIEAGIFKALGPPKGVGLKKGGNLPVKNLAASLPRTYSKTVREKDATSDLNYCGDYAVIAKHPALYYVHKTIEFKGVRMFCPVCGDVDFIDDEHIRQYRPTLSLNHAVKFRECGHIFMIEDNKVTIPLEPKPMTTRKEVLNDLSHEP